MCAAFEFQGKKYKPKQKIPSLVNKVPVWIPWVGFARSEIITWWQRKGQQCLIPVDRYAERNHQTHTLHWMEASQQQWITGIFLEKENEIKIVTRHATLNEETLIGHDRMPVLADWNQEDKSLFSPPVEIQRELMF
jgi:putative SOS response-associated peptidase YedK